MKMIKMLMFVTLFSACGDSIPMDEELPTEERQEDCIADPCSCVRTVKYENFETGHEVGVFVDNVVINGVPELLTARDKRTFKQLSYDACNYGYRDPLKGYSLDMTLDNETVIRSLTWPPLVQWLESF